MDAKLEKMKQFRNDTCLSTRAVHLDLAGDMSTDSFILALRRFTARRGNPKSINSDNGTNFVGAERELGDAIKSLDQNRIRKELCSSGITWNFNPPQAPWMGGAWESLVKSSKRALKSIVRDRLFTEEALVTFLAEVEMTLNSRPITAVSDDLDDYEALTPNHFLLGRCSPHLPIGKFADEEVNLRSKWRAVQAASNMFWARWRKEYLPTLTVRSKWSTNRENLKPGDLVILCDPSTTRGNWPLGKVIRTYTSGDDIVRSVDVKTNSGVYRRAVASLALLEG